MFWWPFCGADDHRGFAEFEGNQIPGEAVIQG